MHTCIMWMWSMDTECCGQEVNTRFWDNDISAVVEGELECISATRSTATGTSADNCVQRRKHFGRVIRTRNTCTEMLEERVDGRKDRVEPRRRWTDDVKDWSNRTVTVFTFRERQAAMEDVGAWSDLQLSAVRMQISNITADMLWVN